MPPERRRPVSLRARRGLNTFTAVGSNAPLCPVLWLRRDAFLLLPLTHRDCASSQLFHSAHRKRDEPLTDFGDLKTDGMSHVFYMGGTGLKEIRDAFFLFDMGSLCTPVAVVRRGTLPDQSEKTLSPKSKSMISSFCRAIRCWLLSEKWSHTSLKRQSLFWTPSWSDDRLFDLSSYYPVL